jgi:hypothetical protein
MKYMTIGKRSIFAGRLLKKMFFHVLIFDDQRCFLQTGFNNLFDVVTFISNGQCYLFDLWVFQGFLIKRLDF